MIRTLSNCQLLEQIYESVNSLVYRGRRESDQRPIIVKILKEDYPTVAELTRYRQEYEITHSLSIEGVIDVYGIEPYQRTLAILLEDFGGCSLKDYFLGQPIPIQQFLTLAIRLVDILGKIHHQNIIHKDINPSNILWNPSNGALRIIDFGISTQLSRENPTLKNPQVLEGTLAYISPEQTGRMNRSLDYRSDFYSLGVTFYELLTGRLPFTTQDALELVHCHIAQQPIPPNELNPFVPDILSDLVLKLMAKRAEERYQNAFGIKSDLDYCREQLETWGHIEPFPLASRDRTGQFCIPQKLYGRDSEIQALLNAFERVTQSRETQVSRELVLVAGFSGIGKSSLVAEVHKPITQKRGYFIAGKYDQFQRDVPYSAFINAFQDLVKQLLTESEDQLAQWRDRLSAALGPNEQVVIDVIPEIQLITGPQPPVSVLGPTEAQNRFNLVFQSFIRVFCDPSHPLVLFLDDLQWIDSASLKLLKLMMMDEQMQSFLLIGAYRDNEVSVTHPLISLVTQLQDASVIVNTMTLKPLKANILTTLIGDTVHQPPEKTQSLAQLILQKTEGNPFFVNEFLKSLHAHNLLTFNAQSQCWDWEMEHIHAQDFTNNVIELLLNKLKRLPDETQEVLRFAACVGARFDLTTLSIICQRSRENVFQQLKVALQLGLILARSSLNEELVIEDFRFGHDRIQQAAYTLIDPEQKNDVHLRIGRLLWGNVISDAISDRIFEIVDHLNQAEHLITKQSERDEIAALNLRAGQKAKSSTAYGAAVRYLQIGLILLGENAWSRCYSLSLRLHEEAVEAAYLNQDYEIQEQLTTEVFKNAIQVLDQIKVYRVKILARSSQNRHLEATDIGFEVLGLLGLSFPTPTPDYLKQTLQHMTILRGDRAIADLIHLPEMDAEDKLASMQVLSDILSSGYQASFDRFIVSNLTQIELSLTYGNTLESAFAYDCYGITLCGVAREIDAGYDYGRLALEVVDQYDGKSTQSRVIFVFNAFIRHWKDPLQDTIPDLQQGYQVGVETGDLEYACYSLCWEAMHGVLTGQSLEKLAPRMDEFSHRIAEFQQSACLLYLQIYQQTVANLQGRALDLSCLTGEFLTEEAVTIESADNKLALAFFHTFKVFLCYFLEDYTEALVSIKQAKNAVDGMTAAATVVTLNFYESLTCLGLASNASEPERERLLATVTQNQDALETWASFAPVNHRHRFELVEAERSRILERPEYASAAYDRAIALAKQHQYLHEEALANELAGRFYWSQGRHTFAQVYLGEAYYGYFHWGATAKVEQLEQKYPKFVGKTAALSSHLSLRSQTILPVQTTSTTRSSQSLDLAAVLQASQAIAGELVLDKLLVKLLQILIRSAGAQLGHLLLIDDQELHIEASYDVNTETSEVLQSLSPQGRVPQGIMNFVQRTQDDVVLRNASLAGNFTQDPYILKHHTQSILCSPLLNQGKLSAILYLENNLTEGAFTSERLEILRLLSGQAAIALDQARNYQNLGRMVDERTAELSQAYDNLQETHEALKVTQDGLVQSEKMAALGQLIAGIAHEINTPLGAIQSSIQYTAKFLQDNLQSLPQFFRGLSPQQAQQFSTLLNGALEPTTPLSGRDRRRARRQLKETLQKLEVSNADAIASLLIDLGITENLESLLDAFTDPDVIPLLKMVRQLTRVHESTRDINTASDRAAKIVFALKTYARYDHRGELQNANIADGIEAVLTLYQNQLKYGVTVDRKIESIPAIPCYFDELNQVWTNLIHNALQSMNYHGKLTLVVHPDDDVIVVEIHDNGPGIPPEIQSQIFDPFFTTKPPGEGSGLGLDIVKKIVDKHQGSITFQSVPGQTKFIVQIPVQMTSQTLSPLSPVAPSSISEASVTHV